MRYLHTMIRVRHLEESLKFYCEILGLREVKRTESEAGRFTLIFLSAAKDFEQAQINKSPLIELTYNWPNEKGESEELKTGRSWGHLAFAVDNIYETCARLQAAGITINRPPRDGYMAFIKSPDDVSIELLQAGEALAPIEPWVSMANTGSW